MATEEETIAAVALPATVASLTADLRALGLADGDVVIVHSSLSQLGWVVGGAQAVVEALLAVVGPHGTIVMPTQSGALSDPSRWENPPVPAEWMQIIRDHAPAYDPYLTPTRQMGQVVDCFRCHPAAIRSGHPTDSLTAVGPQAAALMAGHTVHVGLGDGSPLAKLYDIGAKVLLLGVDHGNNTSIHLAEYRTDWPSKTRVLEGAPLLVDGGRQWVTFEVVDLDDEGFDTLGDEFAAATGAESTGPVGAGIGRLCQQRDIVDFAVGWLAANRT